jgi:hypothetical protein
MMGAPTFVEGDRVRSTVGTSSEGVVLAISRPFAWVKWDQWLLPCTVDLFTLTLVSPAGDQS